jgi:hypothetical protein
MKSQNVLLNWQIAFFVPFILSIQFTEPSQGECETVFVNKKVG